VGDVLEINIDMADINVCEIAALLLQVRQESHDLATSDTTRLVGLPPVLALFLDERLNSIGIAPWDGRGGEGEAIMETKKRNGCHPKHPLWILRRRCPFAGHALSRPGRCHRIDFGWGELVVQRPVFKLSGDMQTVVRPDPHGGRWRTLSGKLFEVRSALNGKRAGAMTLDSKWTRKKGFEHGVHLLIGGLKHTNDLLVLNYVVKFALRFQ
jgi:hypothetical protein